MKTSNLLQEGKLEDILPEDNGKKRFCMVIDLKKCIGCETCTVSCSVENNVLATNPWNVVMDVTEGSFPNYKRKFIPKPCMHCEKPPCVDVCPTNASYRNDDIGIVGIKQSQCIGCRACVTACPYQARSMNWSSPMKILGQNPSVPKRRMGVVEKCTFCLHKIEPALKEGKQIGTTIHNRDNTAVVSPACIPTCVATARYFGDLNDPESEVSEILRNNKFKVMLGWANTKPNVFYLDTE